jgi:uridine kinase
MPIDKYGCVDFDDITSIRIDLLNQHLNELMQGKTIHAPIYDFKAGKPKENQFNKIKMESKDSIIVMEGIHCLNEKLTLGISSGNKYKIFISAFSQLNIDEKRFVPNSTNRLCRRLVRDFKYRGSSPQQTFTQWKSVRRSEHKYIFPYM